MYVVTAYHHHMYKINSKLLSVRVLNELQKLYIRKPVSLTVKAILKLFSFFYSKVNVPSYLGVHYEFLQGDNPYINHVSHRMEVNPILVSTQLFKSWRHTRSIPRTVHTVTPSTWRTLIPTWVLYPCPSVTAFLVLKVRSVKQDDVGVASTIVDFRRRYWV